MAITKDLLASIGQLTYKWCLERDPDFINKEVEKVNGKHRTNVSTVIANFETDDGAKYRVDTSIYIIRVG